MLEKTSGFWSAWFHGKEFSADWSSDRFATWAGVLAELVGQPVEILEIGSWEGRSAIFFLEYLPHSRITCVDSFEGSPLLRSTSPWREAIPYVEARFDRNLSQYGARVEKRRSLSVPALFQLFQSQKRFDLIYIDGSHDRDDVLMDSIQSWRLLSDQGILIWDDYVFQSARPPGPAIDQFLTMNANQYTELHRGKQLIVRKAASFAKAPTR